MIILDAHNPAPLVEQFARQRMADHRTHCKNGIVLYSNPSLEDETLVLEPLSPQSALLPQAQDEKTWSENLQTFAGLTIASQSDQNTPRATGASLGVMQNLLSALGPKGLQFDSLTLEAFAQEVDLAVAELKSQTPVVFEAILNSAVIETHRFSKELYSEERFAELFPARKFASGS